MRIKENNKIVLGVCSFLGESTKRLDAYDWRLIFILSTLIAPFAAPIIYLLSAVLLSFERNREG